MKMSLTCATCNASRLRPPRLVGGAWYALCTECLYETEMEIVGGGAGPDTGFQVKGIAGLSAQQEADLARPRPTPVA
ncbi:MAG: hypothetical protein JNM90_01695 [Burkholderiales bacterium]|nr:hypothetical protein [Burkholderiales bacterium]